MHVAGRDAVQHEIGALQQDRSILDPFAWDQTGSELMSMWSEPAEQRPLAEATMLMPSPLALPHEAYELPLFPPSLDQAVETSVNMPMHEGLMQPIWNAAPTEDLFPYWMPCWPVVHPSWHQLGSYGYDGWPLTFGPTTGFSGGVHAGFNADISPMQSVEEVRARKALANVNLSGPGLLMVIMDKVSTLHINEQQLFISKIAPLLSRSILGAAPVATPLPRPLRQHILSVVRGARQSSRLQRLKSNLLSSRRAQAAISVELGFIARLDEFSDNTLLKYLQLFRSRMSPENVNKLASIAGLSSRHILTTAELSDYGGAAQPEI
ncbi:hypothetical protein ZWY2020_005671 [Hordeum vulgare]|nr:hypothetical protein ZWY2020_005671 [Hordeum vulgare]